MIFLFFFVFSVVSTLQDLNINTVKPKDPSMSVYCKRQETYRHYSTRHSVDANRLCTAGFFYEGVADRVRCFWCGGALESWSKEDDPWIEHAK